MRDLVITPTGVFPACTFHGGQLIVSFGDASANALAVYRYDPGTLELLTRQFIPFGFARSDAHLDGPWLAYRTNDVDGNRAALWNLDLGAMVATAERCDGNPPCMVGNGYWAWQRAATGFPVMRAPLDNPTAWTQVRNGAPTGLSRILPDGTVRLIDEDRGVIPGGTMPSFAGDLSAREHPDSGVLCRLTDGRELRLWAGQNTMVPICAIDGAGRYAVVTWSPTAVRVAVLTQADFAVPMHADPVLDTSGAAIDMIPFFVGGEWPHTSGGVQGSLDLKVNLPDSPHTFTFVKWGNPKAQEVYRYDDLMIYHHSDATDPASVNCTQPYHFTDGRWVSRLAKVGDVIDCPGNVQQRFDATGHVIKQGVLAYRMTVEAHYLSFDCGGDIGVREVVRLKYDCARGGTGDYERQWFAKDWGWFLWQSFHVGTETMVEEAVMNLRGGVSVDPAPLIVPLPGDAPVTPTVPLPTGVNVVYPIAGQDVPVLSATGTHKIMTIRVPPCPVDVLVRVELVGGSVHGEIDLMDGTQLGRTGLKRPVKFG